MARLNNSEQNVQNGTGGETVKELQRNEIPHPSGKCIDISPNLTSEANGF